MRLHFGSIVIAFGLLACTGRQDGRNADIGAPSRELTPAALVRENAAIQVGGTLEQWSLEWERPPVSVCGPEEVYMAITCPCFGFSYGEMGLLNLVRRRPGHSEERLALTPLFREGENPGWEEHLAVLQRWPMGDSDYVGMDSIDLEPTIRARPVTRVMTVQDYDHDGRATEFVLQVGTLPCGKQQSVLVGVSATDSSLHAFTSVAHPKRPLVLPTYLWDQLRESGGRTEGIDWPCGDHAAGTQTEIRLWIGPDGIDGERREYDCVKFYHRGRLISTERI